MAGTNIPSHEWLLTPLLKTKEELENYHAFLDTIKKMVGCEIQMSESITSNEFKIYGGQTNRYADHYDPTELQDILDKCQEHLLLQNFEFKTVTEGSKRLIKQWIPPFCHAYFGIASCDTESALIVVLDRPMAPENSGSNVLIILNGNTLDQLCSIEKSNKISVEKVKVSTLPPAVLDTESPEEEGIPPRVELEQLDPNGRIYQELVAEAREFGTEFWICQYLGDFVRFKSARIPIIHAHEVKVLESSSIHEPQCLRALVWFALNVESTRNHINLPFGTFVIIRSDQNAHMVAIAKLDSSLY